QLKKGDKLFLYTDGVTEAMNDKKEFFTEQLLTNILKKDMGLEYTLKRVNKEINDFTGDEEQFDDITMLIVEYKKEPSDFLI
ncbi:MAG: serine/threonine-protein phosphatase, partial [Methanobrevibacter sp.]|nr:serine/threonine-protein phosphatase [Methanobrevibacter sp.]